MHHLRRALLLCLIAALALSAGCKSPTLTVMTFNIRYDNPGDGANAWPKRRAFVADIIRKHDPDIIGLQEVLLNQRDQLLADLAEYESVGVGRDDGREKGEFAPVLIRKARFHVLEAWWFWLSETPWSPGSKSWDAACPRIVTWIRLRDLATKNELWVFNTHFDHIGTVARNHSAKMIMDLLENLGPTPRIVMGDFNCGPSEAPYRKLLGSIGDAKLFDAFDRVVGDETDAGTFNGFEGVRTGPRIDWILHTEDLVPLTCEIDRDSRDGRYPSDHFPVVARFRMTRRR